MSKIFCLVGRFVVHCGLCSKFRAICSFVAPFTLTSACMQFFLSSLFRSPYSQVRDNFFLFFEWGGVQITQVRDDFFSVFFDILIHHRIYAPVRDNFFFYFFNILIHHRIYILFFYNASKSGILDACVLEGLQFWFHPGPGTDRTGPFMVYSLCGP